jgi:hypothetical protein
MATQLSTISLLALVTLLNSCKITLRIFAKIGCALFMLIVVLMLVKIVSGSWDYVEIWH